MPASVTAAQPVLSQRVESQSASSTSCFADLCAWRIERIARQDWVVVDAKQRFTAVPKDPFETVGHEYRISSRPIVAREGDSTVKPIAQVPPGERYHGPRGRLLAFKKQGSHS
jgi:hypothetical protein